MNALVIHVKSQQDYKMYVPITLTSISCSAPALIRVAACGFRIVRIEDLVGYAWYGLKTLWVTHGTDCDLLAVYGWVTEVSPGLRLNRLRWINFAVLTCTARTPPVVEQWVMCTLCSDETAV